MPAGYSAGYGRRKRQSRYARAGVKRATAGYYARTGRRGGVAYGPRRQPRQRAGRANYRTGGFIGIEKKFFNTLDTNTTIGVAGTITSPSLCLIPQGTTESNRDGRKCRLVSIHCHGVVTLPTSSAPASTADRLRIIIYKDQQTNGAAATAALIMDDNEVAVTIDGYRNLENSQRFWILHDKTIEINSTAGAWDGTNDQYGEQQIHFDWHKTCDIPLEFSATTGAITELKSNNVGVLCISGGGLVGYKAEYRVRFVG